MARIFRRVDQMQDFKELDDDVTLRKEGGVLVGSTGGGGDLTDAVILAPDSSARNVIIPTAADVIALTLEGAATQTADLLTAVNSADAVLFRLAATGQLFLQNNVWHKSVDAKDRMHFVADGNSYWKSAESHVWRTLDSDTDVMSLTGDGVLTTTTLIANYAQSSGVIQIDKLDSSPNFGGIWIGQASPDTNNYSLLGTTGDIFFNAPGSSGTMHFRVNNSDVLLVSASAQFLFGSDVVIAYDAAGYFGIRMFVPSGGAGVIPVVVRGAASQSVSLHEWQDSTTAVLSRINKDGYFMTRKVAAPADGDLATSELAVWLDDTAAAAKLMLKAKDSGGTVRTGIVSLSGVDVADALSDHLTDEDGAHAADAISIADADGNYASTQVEGALLEIANARISDVADFEDHSARHEDGGADEISIAGLSGTSAALQAHLDDTADAHDASAISVLDTATNFTGTDVEAVLAELQDNIDAGGGGGSSGPDFSTAFMLMGA